MDNLLDIYNSDAFKFTTLTAAIQKVQYVPSQITAMKLFSSEGINTTSVSIDIGRDVVALVPNSNRGGTPVQVIDDKISSKSFNTLHLPQTSTILADSLIGRRQFGTTDAMKSIETVRNRLLGKHKRAISLTHEHLRLGALMGELKDADGTTTLLDIYSEMGVTQDTVDFEFSSASLSPIDQLTEVELKIEEALDGVGFTGLHILASAEWIREFRKHGAVKEQWLRYQESSKNRESTIKGFEYGEFMIERYRGGAGVNIPAGKAYAFPVGVDEMFIERFAPGTFTSTVGQDGLDFYSSAEMLKHDKGIEIESQSSPIMLNTRPKAVIELTRS